MRKLTLTLVATAAVASLAALDAAAHEGDPSVLDRIAPYQGPGFRSGTPRVLRAGAQALSAPSFPASGVQLLSWLPLSELSGGSSGNSCYGYTSPSGREYALIGLHGGTAVVEVSDPGDPTVVAVVPGPSSLWRDVRTYQHYMYTVSEGGDGIQVIDLDNVDGGVVTLLGTVTSGGELATHTLFIDTVSGFLYRSGGAANGLRIYSLANPANPVLVGSWSDRYVHEVTVVTYTSGTYAGKQIAFCCGGFNGGFSQTGVSILDVTNKSNIVALKHFSYSGAQFCHQAWPSADLKYLYIDDELDENGGNLTNTKVFDISNLSNPVNKGSFTNPTTAIGHNLYARGNRLFQANYRSGLRVLDLTNPTSPSEIGWFDTWPEDDEAHFNGLWNNYPYFQSGIVIGSDIEKGLFVWWVGAPQLAISYPGGQPANFDPAGASFSVQIAAQNAGVLVAGSAELHVDAGAGWVSTPLASQGGNQYLASLPAQACGSVVRWYVSGRTTNGITWTEPAGGPILFNESVAALSLTMVASDALETKGAWVSGAPDDTASTGKWTHGSPLQSSAQPGGDHTPGAGANCWFTQQAWSGATANAHDVDDGKTTLTSAPIDLSGLSDPFISYWRWYDNAQGATAPDDSLLVEIAGSPFGPWVTVETVGPTGLGTSGGWFRHTFRATDFVAAGPSVQLRFVASDTGVDSLVEAAIDDLEVFDLGCPGGAPQVYCTAKSNSQGCLPHMGSSGVPSTSSATPFLITASAAINQKSGLLFYGYGQAATAFQGGTLCIAAPVKRTGAQNSGGNALPEDCSGAYAIDFNAVIQSGSDPLLAQGAPIYAQFWTRDPADLAGFGSGLTDALSFVIQ